MNIPPFALERYFARYEFHVEHMLCGSDCESLEIGELLGMEPEAAEVFRRQRLSYTESAGAPELRQEICGLYTTIRPEHVLVCSGAEEAVFLLMHAVLHAGDHVVVHSPCYQSLAEVARSIGCAVSAWTGDESRDWELDPADLARALRPNTKLIVINTPHNPTGYLMSPERFRETNAIAQERGITLFSDEVYRESEHDPAERLPAACDVNHRAVSLGVMSKTYGLPGLRIGWIATHDAGVLSAVAMLKDYTTICNSAPSEFLAALALRHRREIAERNLGIIRGNLDVLDAFFARHGETFLWRRPRAGSIAFPKLMDRNVESFCRDLVSSAGVLLLPGSLFEDTGNHFRIGFGRKGLPPAVDRLENFCWRKHYVQGRENHNHHRIHPRRLGSDHERAHICVRG